MTRLTNPMPLFLDLRGALLDAGFVYIGTAGADPELSPIPVFFDAAMTIPAAQPLRTRAGQIVNGASPSFVYFAEDDASVRIETADGEVVNFIPNIAAALEEFQPLDADLTAIAGLATTAFGRGLLTLANAAALKAATGIPDPLPLTGGTVSGNILRNGGGVHPYWAAAGMTGGRIYITASGASDPTSLPGDIWLIY